MTEVTPSLSAMRSEAAARVCVTVSQRWLHSLAKTQHNTRTCGGIKRRMFLNVKWQILKFRSDTIQTWRCSVTFVSVTLTRFFWFLHQMTNGSGCSPWTRSQVLHVRYKTQKCLSLTFRTQHSAENIVHEDTFMSFCCCCCCCVASPFIKDWAVHLHRQYLKRTVHLILLF